MNLFVQRIAHFNAYPSAASAAAAALATLLSLFMGSAQAASFHDHADIERAATAIVTAQLAPAQGRMKATADIDGRLKLARCTKPLEAQLPYSGGRKSRVTAEVSCTGSQPWRLYVPVTLQIWQPVLVATGPLQRGHLLAAGDMILAERTLGQQSRGFMLDSGKAVGFRLKRSLSEGDVLTPGVIIAPPLIERGQRVTLQAKYGQLMVQMAGVALEAGLAGDIIRVENTESGRKVEGVVRSAKTVEVLLN